MNKLKWFKLNGGLVFLYLLGFSALSYMAWIFPIIMYQKGYTSFIYGSAAIHGLILIIAWVAYGLEHADDEN